MQVCLLSRHSILSTRFAANIKRTRVDVHAVSLNRYIVHLIKLKCKCGTKYLEQSIDTSNIAFSPMLCGSADGELTTIC